MSKRPDSQLYLPPEYQARLDKQRGQVEAIEFTSGNDQSSALQGLSLGWTGLSVAMQNPFAGKEAARLSSEGYSAETLRQSLQLITFQAVSRNIAYLIPKKLVTVQIGEAQAAGEEDIAERGRVLGKKIIQARARDMTTSLLGAAEDLFTRLNYLDDPDSATVTGQASKALSNPRDRRGFFIGMTDAMWDGFHQQGVRAQEQYMASTGSRPEREGPSRIHNLSKIFGRSSKAERKTLDNISMKAIEVYVEKVFSEMPEPLELTEAEILNLVHIATQVIRITRKAGKRKPDILNDPRTQRALYLQKTLEGHNIKAEMAAFEKDISIVTQQALGSRRIKKESKTT